MIWELPSGLSRPTSVCDFIKTEEKKEKGKPTSFDSPNPCRKMFSLKVSWPSSQTMALFLLFLPLFFVILI